MTVTTGADPDLAEVAAEDLRELFSVLPGIVVLLSVGRDSALTLVDANAEGRRFLPADGQGAVTLPAELSDAVCRQLATTFTPEDVTMDDGTTLEVVLVAVPATGPRSRLVMCLGRDVTVDRAITNTAEALAAELHRSNEDLQKFAYVASHDLSEPLRMVSSFVELLGKRYSGRLDATADEYIRFALEGTQRMRALIEDLMLVATIRTSPRVFATVDLNRVVAEVLDDVQQLKEKSGARVNVEPLPNVVGDRTQMRQVVQNLVSNSMKFHTGTAVNISITAQIVGGECRMSIDDDGIGVEEQHRERAFDMFARLNPRSVFPGNGIGLGVAHRIVEAHGGRIWIEASDMGGARVVLTLPLAPPAPATTEDIG